MNSSVCFARQLHQHEVRLHRLRGLLAPRVLADLAGDGPEILAVVEHLGIGHVVQAVDGRLQLQQQLRDSARALRRSGRHRRRVLEQRRKDRRDTPR